MKKWLNILLLVISWIVFPFYFIYSIYRNKGVRSSMKYLAYFSVIFSPFTLGLVVVLVVFTVTYQPKSFSIDKMEESLNIELDGDYSIKKNSIIQNGRQDYNATVVINLSNESLENLISQIEKSTFYNLNQDFYGNDELKWKNSDTVTYWKVRNYLEEKKLTGYWIKQDDLSYDFYEPTLSDIPNSAILFHEGYTVSAHLSKKDKILQFEYIKY